MSTVTYRVEPGDITGLYCGHPGRLAQGLVVCKEGCRSISGGGEEVP